MGNGQARKKKPAGNNKRISSELPIVKCEKMNCRQLAFNWDIKGLSGQPEDQKKILMEKIMEMPEHERQKAAMNLLDAPGNNNFVVAAILIIKELKAETNLGTIATKAFSGRSYDECVGILAKAGLSFDEAAMEMVRKFCDKKAGLPIELYQVPI